MTRVPLTAALGLGLRAARRQAGLTQVRLGAEVGLDPATLGNLERGSGSLSSLNKVLTRLGRRLRSRALPDGPVGPALSLLRRRLKRSRRALARELDLSRETLATLEAGGSCRIEMLVVYAAALGVRFELEPVDAARAFFTGTAASSVNTRWTTPPDLGALLNAALGCFDLDPCAPSRNGRAAPVKARLYLTNEDDGLAAHWSGLVYVNPPYGRALARWMEKCWREAEAGARIVALVPARTDTRWWHDHVAGHADILLLRGRLKFGGQHKDAPFPSALVAWNLSGCEVERLCESMPNAAHIAPIRTEADRDDSGPFPERHG